MYIQPRTAQLSCSLFVHRAVQSAVSPSLQILAALPLGAADAAVRIVTTPAAPRNDDRKRIGERVMAFFPLESVRASRKSSAPYYVEARRHLPRRPPLRSPAASR